MTTSIAEPAHPLSHRPVLRRLVDILPPVAPATPECAPAPARQATDPTACIHAERVLRAAVEILGGRRPVHQLSAVLGPDLLCYLASLQVAAGHLQPWLRKVRTQQHCGGVLEAVAIVTLNTGVRALTARFEQHGNRWCCTALHLHLTTGDLATRRGRRTRRL